MEGRSGGGGGERKGEERRKGRREEGGGEKSGGDGRRDGRMRMRRGEGRIEEIEGYMRAVCYSYLLHPHSIDPPSLHLAQQ